MGSTTVFMQQDIDYIIGERRQDMPVRSSRFYLLWPCVVLFAVVDVIGIV